MRWLIIATLAVSVCGQAQALEAGEVHSYNVSCNDLGADGKWVNATGTGHIRYGKIEGWQGRGGLYGGIFTLSVNGQTITGLIGSTEGSPMPFFAPNAARSYAPKLQSTMHGTIRAEVPIYFVVWPCEFMAILGTTGNQANPSVNTKHIGDETLTVPAGTYVTQHWLAAWRYVNGAGQPDSYMTIDHWLTVGNLEPKTILTWGQYANDVATPQSYQVWEMTK